MTVSDSGNISLLALETGALYGLPACKPRMILYF